MFQQTNHRRLSILRKDSFYLTAVDRPTCGNGLPANFLSKPPHAVLLRALPELHGTTAAPLIPLDICLNLGRFMDAVN